MATIVEKENKDGSISYKAVVRYKGVFLTKTFSVKGSRKKTTMLEASNWGRSIEGMIDDGTYRKEEKKHNYTVSQAIEKYIQDGNPKKDEKTRQRHIKCLNWFKKELGSLPIKTLERSDIKTCRNKLMKKPKEIPIKGKTGKVTNKLISNSTINRYLAFLG